MTFIVTRTGESASEEDAYSVTVVNCEEGQGLDYHPARSVITHNYADYVMVASVSYACEYGRIVYVM